MQAKSPSAVFEVGVQVKAFQIEQLGCAIAVQDLLDSLDLGIGGPFVANGEGQDHQLIGVDHAGHFIQLHILRTAAPR